MEIEPIHAIGLFNVTKDLEINQIIIYEYWDPELYYYKLQENTEELERELETLIVSMQALLDKEEVVINGEKIKPKVVAVYLAFRDTEEEPYLVFFIKFRGKPVKGENYYENLYEEEIAEYPFEAYWIFPDNMVIKQVEASGQIEILGDNILVLRIREGEKIQGYEKIVFTIK